MAKKTKGGGKPSSTNPENNNGNDPTSNSGPLLASSSSAVAAAAAAARRPDTPPLLISRHKHWRYISCYHGYWHTMPEESLEKTAHLNYNVARPALFHAGTLFDLVRIRHLVTQAKEYIHKAQSQDNSSAKRLFQARRMACQRLAEAYRIDEIATSVAVMQETTAIDDVASKVRQETSLFARLELAAQLDVRYVYFFEEKIPSRQVREYTNLDNLSGIVAACSLTNQRYEVASYQRTLALVEAFRDNHDNSANYLTGALQNARRFMPPGRRTWDQLPAAAEQQQQQQQQGGDAGGERLRRDDVELKPEERPTGLEAQLLFQRATMNLTLACSWLEKALPGEVAMEASSVLAILNSIAAEKASAAPGTENKPKVDESKEDAKQRVKEYARKARRDYMAFLEQLEYSPDMPAAAVYDQTQRLKDIQSRSLRGTRTEYSGLTFTNSIYRVSELFQEVPVAGLPPWPPPSSTELGGGQTARPAAASEEPDQTARGNSSNDGAAAPSSKALSAEVQGPSEFVTFHPLLSEVLHSLLLCHCLAQTSSAELIRHAYMVSRLLACAANPMPLFQPCKTSARMDWMDVLHRVRLAVPYSWEALTPLRVHNAAGGVGGAVGSLRDADVLETAPYLELGPNEAGGDGGIDISEAAIARQARAFVKGHDVLEVAASERDYPNRGFNVARWMLEVDRVKLRKKRKPVRRKAGGGKEVEAEPEADDG